MTIEIEGSIIIQNKKQGDMNMSDLQIKITMGELDIFLQGEGDLVYKVFSDIRQNGIGELKNASAIDTSKSKPLVTENQKYSTKN